MVYRVVADGVDIFGSDTDSTLISPSLELELNSAGSLEFTLPPDHSAYDDIQLMQTEIEVYEDGDLIFFGRVSEVNIDWFKQKKVTCEGALAYLNDAAIRPHTFEGALISDVFKYIIAQYNAQVAQNRQITVGNITIVDRYVYTEFDYDICLSVLTSTCIDSTGGYLFVRKDDNDVMYIDWLAEVPDTSDQPVQFASNMLDLDQDTKADDVCTVVLPLGGQVDGVNVTIASVNQGSDILENADGIAKYGRILKIHSFGDIVDAQVLKDKAQEWLTKQQEEALTIEADAAELHYLDGSVGAYHLGQVVDVISGPHGINEEYPILKMSMELDSGTKKVTLGTPPRKELTELSVSGGSSGGSSSSGGGGGGGSSDGVRDVLVNGSSVVSDHVARVSAVTAQQLADGLALKADEDDFEALQTTVAGKASQADLNALSTAVAGKASQADLNALSNTVAGKASQADLNALSNTVSGKQDQLTPGTGISIDANNVISATGGGGTEVEANPSDPATDDLNTIKIGDTVYDIPGGGGGGSYTAGSHIEISNNEISVRLHDDSPLTPSEFDYTGTVQTYTVPYDAIYKLQVWGASGGDGTGGRSHAGYGGYTEGKISLTAGEVLYIYVGQAGVGGSSGGDSVRFNGGGKANHSGSWSRGSGGGATHIAKVSGLLSSLDQNINDILVVAGGGGGAGYYSGGEYGTGGSGGGYIGGNGISRVSGTAGTGATQQAGGTGAETGSFGKGADKSDTSSYGGSGGGGGFYGGGSSANTSGAGGGSGYYNPNLTDACMYGYEVSESSGSSNKTVSVSEYDADPVPQVAKSGNGYAIITCLGTTGTDLITREDMRESIEDAIEEAKFNNLTMMSDYYSEDEQVVGRWTDGKPLYQKTWTGLNVTPRYNVWTNIIDVSNLNIDELCEWKSIGGNTVLDGSGIESCISSNGYFMMERNANVNPRQVEILTLQYTKTTDAPGTGPTKGNLIYLPALYSEEEREVGVWKDGKPIYQKNIPIPAIQSAQSGVLISNLGLNIDNCVDIKVRLYKDTTPDNDSVIATASFGDMYFYYRKSEDSIRMDAPFSWVVGRYGNLTIQYTKTTDQPGSGTWTPEGQLAHHYSTSEKVVGTWIDGSTVYERTWVFDSQIALQSNSWYSTDINASGFGKIIRTDCMDSNGTCFPIGAANSDSIIKLISFRGSGQTGVKWLTLQYTKTS